MIDSLATWKSTFASLPRVGDSTWADNFANWVAARVVNGELSGITDSSPPSFTFGTSTFKTKLLAMTPTSSLSTAAAAFASAWGDTINASSLAYDAGSYIGSATPSTTWASISSQSIDAASVTAAKSALQSAIIGLTPVGDVDDSQIPKLLRDAFLSLTGTISGLDSTPPPTGPLPLVAAGIAFV